MKTGYESLPFKDPRLARYIPTDFDHVEKYPLTAASTPHLGTPIAAGVNWYSAFDNPIKDKDGKFWVGKNATYLGVIRGGHAICLPPNRLKDPAAWYKYYNQGQEGACVGFAASRMMSLLNRQRYDAFWLYNKAKEVDEWFGEDYDGTSVRAAMDILRNVGHKYKGEPDLKLGIAENRWATTIDELLTALHSAEYKRLGAIPFLNSWGPDYPHKVWMPCETWERLLKEYGEFTLITDRTN